MPTALRASAEERSALAPHVVAPLWRAPLAQSAGTQRKVTDERCADPTLSMQTLHVPHVISAVLEHAHPCRLHSGGSLRSQQGLRAMSRGRSEA